ncbi:MAG: hypothetical protein PHS65_07310 [Arcobacteraceae bacterium]|nr:hypothetical protein [Arcobacteraceae bacterium]
MINIKIPKLCGCAKKKKLWNKKYTFETLKEAEKKAKKMCKKANEKYCEKHTFEYEVKKDNVIIHIKKS